MKHVPCNLMVVITLWSSQSMWLYCLLQEGVIAVSLRPHSPSFWLRRHCLDHTAPQAVPLLHAFHWRALKEISSCWFPCLHYIPVLCGLGLWHKENHRTWGEPLETKVLVEQLGLVSKTLTRIKYHLILIVVSSWFQKGKKKKKCSELFFWKS